MSDPNISIIIPVYNRAKELAECLESIQNQTIYSPSSHGEGARGWWSGLEVIVVDDGSDEPVKIAPPVIRGGLRGGSDGARLIHQENKGAPAARNRGFDESHGEYVIFCDADVVMKPDMLAKMSKVLDENPNVSYVYSSFKFGWKMFKLWEFSADRLRQMPYIHTTSLIRKEHFPGFDETLSRLQDWDLWLTLLEQGHTGQWLPEALFSVRSGGTMSRWLPSFLAGRSKEYQRAVSQVKHKHSLF